MEAETIAADATPDPGTTPWMADLNRWTSCILVGIALLAAGGCGARAGSAKQLIKEATGQIERVQDRNAVHSALASFAEIATLEPYFAASYGCVIFPTVGKGGVGIGGAHGRGFVFRKGKLAGESTLSQLTIGFQLGAQAFSQIVFFENAQAYEHFTAGNFELSAQASAVALTQGASAQADTAGGASAGAGRSQAKRDYTNGMAIFIIAKGGLMYEASVGGQKFTFRPVENR